ncbi:MAG: septation protein IspZ [Luminiphilus sp.]|nr:septation protein IspZ [Luminiphilus sp.]
MRIWTYLRPFSFRDVDYVVEVSFTFTKTFSRFFRGNELLDEQSVHHMDEIQTLVHSLANDEVEDARVEVGYVSWWSVGIAVMQGEDTIYESHPGKNVRVAEGMMRGSAPSPANEGSSDPASPGLDIGQMIESNQSKWERNKYSIYADLALGALFYLIGKFTEDLALAAIVGAAAGLALVVAQRFVKVDLLGGFAVFGTIMLLISAGFSLALQDDYWVQMKSTVLGIFTATLFMLDGVLRNGAYFGARIERYMPLPLHHGRIAIGISLTGLLMAYGNYFVAENFSEDFWLTYTTFLDIPVSMAMFYAVMYWARKKPTDIES